MAEINEKEIKRRLEAISRFETRPEVTARDLERVRQMLTKQAGEQETRPQNIWRIIMKSRISKLAAAAVIIIAVLIGVNYFGGSVDMAGIAWGEIIEKIEQVPTVVYKMTTVISFPGANREMSTKSDIYDGGAQGIRVDIYMNGELAMQKFMLPGQEVAYFIRPREKQYTRFELTDEQAAMKEDFPRQWVKTILSEDYAELGPGNINGIEVEGVEVHNSKLLGGDKGVVRFWVDVKTNLPVRFELEGMMMESGAKRPTKHVIDDFQWDVEIDTSIFEPNIPDDYTLLEK